MSNTYFQFRQFRIDQKRSGMKVTTDGCLFGAWVANQLLKNENEPSRILDIGSGTGLLSLMLGQVTHQTQIDAVEVNDDAFEEASRNFSNSDWSDRLQCFHSSIQKFLPDHKYDIIICNPPFFGKNQKGRQSGKNLAVHNDSLSMEELSIAISRHISDTGMAYVLYPEWEMKAFVKWMEKQGLSVKSRMTVRNKEGSSVFREVCSFDRKTSNIQESEIYIRDSNGGYTNTFNQLLKYYYLEA